MISVILFLQIWPISSPQFQDTMAPGVSPLPAVPAPLPRGPFRGPGKPRWRSPDPPEVVMKICMVKRQKSWDFMGIHGGLVGFHGNSWGINRISWGFIGNPLGNKYEFMGFHMGILGEWTYEFMGWCGIVWWLIGIKFNKPSGNLLHSCAICYIATENGHRNSWITYEHGDFP